MIVGVLTTCQLGTNSYYSADVCRITNAPVRYITKTWSVVLLNRKIHILLSQVYCV